MKFKTWEKVYWGIISVFFLVSVVFALFHQEDIPVKIGKEYQPVSKGAYIGYALLGYLIIFVPIWLVVRWIINRNDKERERESGNNAYQG